VTIRTLFASDLERIKEIDRAAFPPADWYEDAMYDSMLQSGLSLVALDEKGEIAGYAFVVRLDAWPWAQLSQTPVRPECLPHPHVRSIAVYPEQQRRGYASKILRAVIENAVNSVDLLVDESNAPAVRLYESLGFARAETVALTPPKRRMVLSL